MPEVSSGFETDRMSKAERAEEEKLSRADDRTSEVRSWFQPVSPEYSTGASPAEASPAEASPAEASRTSDRQPVTASKASGSESADRIEAYTEPETVVLPKLRVSRPQAQNGTATAADAETVTSGPQPAEAKTVPPPPAPPASPPAPPASPPAAPASPPAEAKRTPPAEAKRTPSPGGGGSDKAAAKETRGLHSGSKSPAWPDALNETEPETVILPKLQISRPQAQNGTGTKTGTSGPQPAEGKTAPPVPVPVETPGGGRSGKAAAKETRGLYSGSKSPAWPETEPETVILPKLRVSRPQAQNGPAGAGAVIAAKTGTSGQHQPAEAKAAAQVAPEKLVAPPNRRLKRAIERHRPLIVALAVIVVIAATATLISVRLDASPRPSGAPPLDIPTPGTSQVAQVAASGAWPTTAPDSAPATCKQVSLKGVVGASVVSYLDDNTSQRSLVANEAKGLDLLNFSWTSLASPTHFIASDSFAPSLATELTAANQSGPCGLRFTTLSDNDPAMSHSDDVRMMTKVLTSSSVRQAHVLAVAQWMAGQPLATGLTIDYENGLPQNLSDLKTAEQAAGWSGLSLDEAVNRLSNDYTQLIGEIATAMHRQHRLVRLMAPVRYSDDVDATTTDIAPYLLNYGALAQYVDQIVLKAYDFNFATGNPGPIAPFADVAKVLTYVHSYNVPWSKLAVIEPLYAYNWTVNKSGNIALSASGQPISATTLNATQVNTSKKQWHEEKTENGETEYTYTQSGQKHIVWDASSALKTEMAWLKRNYPQIGIDASTIGNADPTGSALAVTVLGS